MTEFDAGDTEAVAERERRLAIEREREIEELRGLLATYGGRRFVWRLMEQCGFHRLSYAGMNHAETDFREGRRSIGNWLFSEVFTADEEAYTIMRREAAARATAGNLIGEGASDG